MRMYLLSLTLLVVVSDPQRLVAFGFGYLTRRPSLEVYFHHEADNPGSTPGLPEGTPDAPPSPGLTGIAAQAGVFQTQGDARFEVAPSGSQHSKWICLSLCCKFYE